MKNLCELKVKEIVCDLLFLEKNHRILIYIPKSKVISCIPSIMLYG